jgi:ABC-2 type transport system ATP-binding protein
MDFLNVCEVSKQYDGHLALDRVSLSIPKKSICGLLGPNGAGKTTLIRIINQITAPDSGEIFLNGKLLSRKDISRIGYLPEERGLYKKMKVGEQALYLAQLKGVSKEDALLRLKYWFEKFEIQPWWNKKVEELSKGMAQKIQFITTVLHEPELLIFDEPFSGFDPVNANLLKQEILALREKGATIIFSTHNMESVEELCDEISLINQSKVVLQGNVAQVRATFKKQIYTVVFEGIYSPSPISCFECLSSQLSNGIATLRIRTESPNDALKEILKDYKIISFSEEVPSMNEIFINAIKTSSK